MKTQGDDQITIQREQGGGIPTKTVGMLLLAAAALIMAGWAGGARYGARA